MISDFLSGGSWISRTIDKHHTRWVGDTIREIKPQTVLETGTGANSGYALATCAALREVHGSDCLFMSYEIYKPAHKSACSLLKPFDPITELHCGDMFGFFLDYAPNFIPDMCFLDAGDERLWSGDTIPGKQYDSGSYYENGESENLAFFLRVQSERSAPGTHVILDDFLAGRGSYIADYILKNKDEFDANWDALNIVKSRGSGASLFLCRRK